MTVYILGIACVILLCAIALVFIMFYGGFNGNAYLSLYLFGIVIGNSRIRNKQMLIPFFDGVTCLSQILIFSLIGLLSFPSQMPHIVQLAIMIKRDKESIITKGDTLIRAGDNIILSVPPYTPSENDLLSFSRFVLQYG